MGTIRTHTHVQRVTSTTQVSRALPCSQRDLWFLINPIDSLLNRGTAPLIQGHGMDIYVHSVEQRQESKRVFDTDKPNLWYWNQICVIILVVNRETCRVVPLFVR